MKHTRDPVTGRCALCDSLGLNSTHDDIFYPEGSDVPERQKTVIRETPRVIEVKQNKSYAPVILPAETPAYAPVKTVLPPIGTSGPRAYHIYTDIEPPPTDVVRREERKQPLVRKRSEPLKPRRRRSSRGGRCQNCCRGCSAKLCWLGFLVALLILLFLALLAFLGYGIYRLHKGLTSVDETHVYRIDYSHSISGTDQGCQDVDGTVWDLESYNNNVIETGRRRRETENGRSETGYARRESGIGRRETGRVRVRRENNPNPPIVLTTTLQPCSILTTVVSTWSNWSAGNEVHISASPRMRSATTTIGIPAMVLAWAMLKKLI